MVLLIGVGLMILGVGHYYMLFHSVNLAHQRTVQALELLTARYTEAPGRFTIPSAGITIICTPCAGWCILHFVGQDWRSAKAQYIQHIITKYQRFGR